MKLVQNWKQSWRWFSVQSMVVAGSIQGAWSVIPDGMRSSIPANVVQAVTIALLVLGVVGRLVDQPKTK